MPVPGCDQHHDLGLVEEGDVQAGPTGGRERPAGHGPQPHVFRGALKLGL